MEKRVANTQKPLEARASKSLAMKSKCLVEGFEKDPNKALMIRFQGHCGAHCIPMLISFCAVFLHVSAWQASAGQRQESQGPTKEG